MAAETSSSSSRKGDEKRRKTKNKRPEEDDMAAPPREEMKKKKKRKSSEGPQREPRNGEFDEEGGKGIKHERKPGNDQAAAEADGFGQDKKKNKEKVKRKQLEQQQDRAAEDGEEKRKTKKQKRRQQDQRDEKKKSKKKKWTREGDAQGRGQGSGRRRNLIIDERFATAHSDPRFQRPPQRESKITIDSRFSRMFSDKSFFSSSTPVDKRGKPRKEKALNPLLHYYLREEKEEVPVVQEEDGEEDNRVSGSDEELEPSTSEEEDSDGSRVDNDISSSTEEEDDDEEGYQYSENSDAHQFWMASQEDTPTIENETRRLAVVNMDWDYIKAVDLYVLMSTCLLTSCPQNGGQILSVAVYPSEFGLKCMEIEAMHGPHALFDDEKDVDNDDDDNDADDEIVNEKIRSYQLTRLKYYYAVVDCDSNATANHLYNSLDGVEVLRTANVLDLRFIPDSMEFNHPPRDISTAAPPDYKQPDFETSALQHSTVKLTWDDDEPNRKKILRRKFNPEKMDELEQYLASDDSDDDEGNEDHGEKYNFLLQSADASGTDEDNDSGKEMEVTFLPGVENLSKHFDKNKLSRSEEGVWDAYLRKRREKMKAKKNTKKVSSDDDSSDSEYNEGPHQPDDFFVEEPSDFVTRDGKKVSNKGSLKSLNKNSKKNRRHSREKNREEETREASRAELELLLADDDATIEHLKGFNLRPKKAKGKKGKEVSMEDKLPDVDASDDPRFSSRLTSHLFALDPTDPQYKRSATGMRQARAQKQQKGNKRAVSTEEEERIDNPPDDEKPSKEKHNIMSLVRSLKLKSKGLRNGGEDD